jgi:glycosyltransferase involved in cell wall biosynthesis
MKVCAITSGWSTPSARFRVRQHAEPLRQLGIEIEERVPRVPRALPLPGPARGLRRRHLGPLTAAWLGAHALTRLPAVATSWSADATWIERSFVPGLEVAAGVLRRPLLLDIDDAVWLEGLGGRSTPHLARRATAAIAGNAFLADWLSQHCVDVRIVPTAIDCARFVRLEPRPESTDEFVMGWTGTSSNFCYLERIAPALRTVLRDVPGASLRIVADRRPMLTSLHGLPVHFEAWTPLNEVAALRHVDVGLMPLDDTDWTRGKCSFKMLQYMALGIPTVVSPVGMNREVLAHGESGFAATSHDEWVDALRQLARDPLRRRLLGATGRSVAESRYDVRVIAARLAGVFRSLS